MANAVRVLGPLLVVDADGVAVDPGGKRQRRLLAALAIHRGDVVSVDTLIDIVFEGHPTEAAGRTLQTYVSRLRRSLDGNGSDSDGDSPGRHGPDGEGIERIAPGYVLTLDAEHTDSGRMESLLAAAQSAAAAGDHAKAVGLFDQALRLSHGEPYAEFAAEPWAMAEATRLTELRATAIEDRAESQLALGGHAEVIGDLEPFTVEEAIRERPRRQLMLALYRSGRQAESLRVYNNYFALLSDEMGLEPSGEIRELESKIIANDPSLDLIPMGGQSLRGYQLYEELGRGLFSTVFRGTQPAVGRDVAVKVIRADLANDPEFIRRFETEAHLVATLEHPYIVPLYDFWREPGAAYLVMRWLRGGTLETRITARPLSLTESGDLITQVGEALDFAHASGIVHRDVKPGNVFLDDLGNYFLGDFGIARAAAHPGEPQRELDIRQLPYASPEQIREEPVGPETDVYNVGVLLYEALTGHRPFAATSAEQLIDFQLHQPLPIVARERDDVPAAVDEVIQRATAKFAAGRYTSAGQLVREFGEAIGVASPLRQRTSRSGRQIEAGPNPYKGLKAFGESDSGDFFGRGRVVDELLAALARPRAPGRLVTVVGASGSGKSSLVHAGLVPSLREGSLPGSKDWFVATMMPGRKPYAELESALLKIAVNPPDRLMETLTSGPSGIATTINRVLPTSDSELVLVVDQFEEIYTMTEHRDVAGKFVEALLAATTDPHSRTRVVLTLRADFYDRPLGDPVTAEAIKQSTVVVTPLSSDELAAAIEKPAQRVGAHFEDGLVARIAADLTDQPGALPLLQYTLAELYDRSNGVLTHETYEAVGGISQAMANRAETIYRDLAGHGIEGTRLLFSRLVTLGDGSEDTRRRVVLSEFRGGIGVEAAMEAFGSSRMLSFDHDPVSREPTVEVAHEALIREWPRLRNWIDDDRDGLRVHRHLTDATAAWEARGRDPADLYRGSRLAGATAWSDKHPAELNQSERRFLDTSSEASEADQARTRRQNRRLRGALVIVALVAAIALVAGMVAFREERTADQAQAVAQIERDSAESAQLLADQQAELAAEQAKLAGEQAELALERQNLLDGAALRSKASNLQSSDPRLATLLALEAYRVDPTPLSLDALGGGLLGSPGWMGSLPTRWVQYSEFGPWLVSSEGSDLVVRSVDDFDEVIRRISFADAPNGPRSISPGGDRIAQIVGDKLHIVDLTNGEIGPPDTDPTATHPESRRRRTWLPTWTTDGSHVVVNDKPVAIYKVDGITAELVHTVPVASALEQVPVWIATHPEEELMALSIDGEIEIWDTSTLGDSPPEVLKTYDDLQAVILNWADDGTLYVISTAGSGRPVSTIREVGLTPIALEGVNSAAVWVEPLSDGNLFVGGPAEARVIDPVLGEVVAGPWPTSHGGAMMPVELDGGDTLAVNQIGDQSVVDLWSVVGGNTLSNTLPPGPSSTQDMHAQYFPSDGIVAFGVGRLYPTSVWLVAAQELQQIKLDGSADDRHLIVSPTDDGAVVASVDGQGNVTIHELPSGRSIAGPYPVRSDLGGGIGSVYVNANRSVIYVMEQEPQQVTAYGFTTGDKLGETEPGGSGGWWTVLQEEHGQGVMVGLGGTQIFDLESLEPLGNVVKTLGSQAFPAESGSLMTVPASGLIEIIDLESADREVISSITGTGSLAGFIGTADDYLVGWGTYDRSEPGIGFWDIESGQSLGPIVGGIVGDLSTRGAVTQVREGRAHVWNVDPSTWPEIACQVTASNLSLVEWEAHMPGDEPIRATCPQLPLVSEF
jgi:serine/threonine protein kinase/DNA-binding SARP family transcriptional activator/WD40 repeat protein